MAAQLMKGPASVASQRMCPARLPPSLLFSSLAPAPKARAAALTGRGLHTRACAAQLHLPHIASSGDVLFDILIGSAMQAQQVAGCYNNCLATSVAVVRAAELLDQHDYKLVFGHLASTRADISAEVPHVWVEWRDQLILDATISDAMSTQDGFDLKKQLKFVHGRAANPMKDVGLPKEAPNQDRLEHYAANTDEYVNLLAAAPAGTPQAAAYLLYLSLTQGLFEAKEEIQQMLTQQQQQPAAQ